MRPSRRNFWLWLAPASVWLMASGGAQGGSGRYLEGHLSPLEELLFADAADGQWDRYSLFTAALVASGVAETDALGPFEARLSGWVAELEQSGKLAGSPQDRAAAVFERMHGRILIGGYRLDATELTAALDEGCFNCVSSSVLFCCLARRCGLRACGLEIPGHAGTRIYLESGTLDVETTCPDWFRAIDGLAGAPEGDSPVFAARKSGQSPARKLGQSPARALSQVELVAMIYYNRGVDLLTQKRFAEAAAANAKALRLDPAGATARGNLLATLNNWAIDQGSRGRYAEAAELLEQGLALAPDYKTLKTNFVHVHHRWIEELCRNGEYEQALRQLDQAARTVPGNPYFGQARRHVVGLWVRSTGGGDGVSQRLLHGQ